MNNPWIPNNISGSSQALRTVAGTLGGFSLRETAGSTAVVVLYDNSSAASGTILEEIALTANQALNVEYKRGIRALNGIYIAIVSGAVAGSVRTD